MKNFTILLGTGLLFGCQSNESVPPDPRYAAIDTLLLTENEAGRFSGSVVIGNQDSMLYERHLGTANRVWNVSVDHETRFDVASVNKSFIAALILLAAEEGKLRVTNRLTDLLSGFNYQGTFDSAITVHHLLSHTSGLPDYDGVPKELSADGFMRFKRLHMTNAEYVDFISKLPPVAPPGQQFYYSNFAYHLLSIVLEEIYQQPFAEILRLKICEPLNLQQTFSTTANQAVFPRVAEGYDYVEDKNRWVRNRFIDLTLGRRIFSTTYDLYLWGKAMNDDRLLRDSSLQQMQRNYLEALTHEFSYGYGWVVFETDEQFAMGNLDINEPYIIHGGNTEGYKAMLVNVNRGNLIFSLLANTGSQTNEMELTKKIIHILTVPK